MNGKTKDKTHAERMRFATAMIVRTPEGDIELAICAASVEDLKRAWICIKGHPMPHPERCVPAALTKNPPKK